MSTTYESRLKITRKKEKKLKMETSEYIVCPIRVSVSVQKQLEIWGKAQHEATRRPKSDWKYNLRG